MNRNRVEKMRRGQFENSTPQVMQTLTHSEPPCSCPESLDYIEHVARYLFTWHPAVPGPHGEDVQFWRHRRAKFGELKMRGRLTRLGERGDFPTSEQGVASLEPNGKMQGKSSNGRNISVDPVCSFMQRHERETLGDLDPTMYYHYAYHVPRKGVRVLGCLSKSMSPDYDLMHFLMLCQR